MTPVYNPKDISVKIKSSTLSLDINGIADKGVSVKFKNTIESVNGISGETGYKIKSRNGASITLNILGTSDEANKLLKLFNDRMDERIQNNEGCPPFTLIIDADTAIGFNKIIFNNCYIIEVDEIGITKSVPTYAFQINCGNFQMKTI